MVNSARFYLFAYAITAVIMDFHIKASSCASSDDLTYPAKTNNPKALAGHLSANHKARTPVFPFSGANKPLSFTCPAGGTKHKHDCDFGSRIREHVRCIGNNQSSGLCSLGVHMIISYRKVGDDFYAIRQTLDYIC